MNAKHGGYALRSPEMGVSSVERRGYAGEENKNERRKRVNHPKGINTNSCPDSAVLDTKGGRPGFDAVNVNDGEEGIMGCHRRSFRPMVWVKYSCEAREHRFSLRPPPER